ncbi:hypothetical protein [Mesomycoplasma molare]|uniref:Uncharacterized protein n=1 Tax=Mesomycoplasma molare TaxID=171288 RepID=A0ABY5TY61_9BACT|nr:hypothetical protein [Mesomycoplasma molare]UWD34511.1 hypothetical protein NX772_01625 [Mesomycoplasma molare]
MKIEEIKELFKKVFTHKSNKDEEESLSCGYKKTYYHFLEWDSNTQIIKYRASSSDKAWDENIFYYDTEITLNELLEMNSKIQ